MWANGEYKKYLDKDICQLVRSLHQNSIKTIFSCAGHLRTSPAHTGVLPYPYVILKLHRENELQNFQEIIRRWHLDSGNFWILSRSRIHGSLTPEYIWKYVLQKNKNYVVRVLCPKSNNFEQSKKLLIKMREEAHSLANFIT